jgi:hypothetical protein
VPETCIEINFMSGIDIVEHSNKEEDEVLHHMATYLAVGGGKSGL